MRMRTHAGFGLFRTASTVSAFGPPSTPPAIQALVVTTPSGPAGNRGARAVYLDGEGGELHGPCSTPPTTASRSPSAEPGSVLGQAG